MFFYLKLWEFLLTVFFIDFQIIVHKHKPLICVGGRCVCFFVHTLNLEWLVYFLSVWFGLWSCKFLVPTEGSFYLHTWSYFWCSKYSELGLWKEIFRCLLLCLSECSEMKWIKCFQCTPNVRAKIKEGHLMHKLTVGYTDLNKDKSLLIDHEVRAQIR